MVKHVGAAPDDQASLVMLVGRAASSALPEGHERPRSSPIRSTMRTIARELLARGCAGADKPHALWVGTLGEKRENKKRPSTWCVSFVQEKVGLRVRVVLP